jgi:hypothetical protein
LMSVFPRLPFVVSRFRVFLIDGSSKTLQTHFCKKNVSVSKSFHKRIDQKFKTVFFSIYFITFLGVWRRTSRPSLASPMAPKDTYAPIKPRFSPTHSPTPTTETLGIQPPTNPGSHSGPEGAGPWHIAWVSQGAGLWSTA